MRLASENAKMGQPEVKLGIIPGYGGSQRLPRLVGKGLAMQHILTGEMITAQEAHRIGLVKLAMYDADGRNVHQHCHLKSAGDAKL